LATGLAIPLMAGIARLARQLGLVLALRALPMAEGDTVDLALTPRRAFVVTIQLGIVLLTGLPLLAVTQPFLGGVIAPLAFALLLLVLGVSFWRGATELHGHVRAGAQAILEALVEQAHRGGVTAEPESESRDSLEKVRRLLPGLGEPTPFEIPATSPAVGRTLAQLNLRGLTGATVLAIQRGEDGLLVPTAAEVLKPGDRLALAGSSNAIDAAKALLEPTPTPA
jgi:CPA2 family monovalent cation:H+ antiporter-2